MEPVKLINIAELIEKIGISRYQLNQLIDQGIITPPLEMGHKTRLFNEALAMKELSDYFAAQKKAS